MQNCSNWQFKIDETDCNKTAFTVHHAQFRVSRIPFEFRSAPETSQITKPVFVWQVKFQYARVYLDVNIILFANADEHVSHVYTALSHLHKAGVPLNHKKCNFFTARIGYLRYVIWPGITEPANKTTDSAHDLKPPRNATELKSFFRLCNLNRQFVTSLPE